MTNEIDEAELDRMAKYFWEQSPPSSIPLYHAKAIARIALDLGAKLPDLRMERGRAAYEAYARHRGMPWEGKPADYQELWALAAEAARAAP